MSATLRQQCQTSLGAGLRWQNYTFYFICAKKNAFHHIVVNAPYIAIHNYYQDIIESFPTVSRRSTDGQRF